MVNFLSLEVMVGGFSIFEHTADVGVAATGDTLEEALTWLAKGMFSLIADPETVAPKDTRSISVAAHDRESLVVDWLNELVYQFEATGFLLRECRVTLEESDTRLVAQCQGEEADPARHRILTVIKAATYHGLTVARNDQWHIKVILDI